MTRREQARIIAGAIHEIVRNSEPNDRYHSRPESVVNAAMASLTQSIEYCMGRADAAYQSRMDKKAIANSAYGKEVTP